MFESTQAIILHCQKYSDKSVILHTYTQQSGRVNLIVYGSAKKGNTRGIMETPLTLVELSYDNRPGKEMHVLHSISPVYIPQQQDSERQLIRMFICEVVYKTLKQPMADERIYTFLTETVKKVDSGMWMADSFMETFSALLGYGGVWLDEWKELKSVSILREMLD